MKYIYTRLGTKQVSSVRIPRLHKKFISTHRNYSTDEERMVLPKDGVIRLLETDMKFGRCVSLHILQRLTCQCQAPKRNQKKET